MDDIINLIDQLIAEHRMFGRQAKELEKVANDVQAIAGLEKAQDAFMPGRLDQKKGLQQFWELLESYGEGINAHFDREETALLRAFEKQGDKELVSALNSLLAEHVDLRGRLEEMKKHTVELISGELGSHFWSAKAHDTRVYMGHTVRLINVHARSEYGLFTSLKKELQRQAR
ncbi:MAG: hemerythrin domain-containing protein [Chloroflexota bacterium]